MDRNIGSPLLGHVRGDREEIPSLVQDREREVWVPKLLGENFGMELKIKGKR